MKCNKNAKLLKRPPIVKLDSLGAIAEARGIYSVDSKREGLMYLYNDGEYMIATASKGYVRLSERSQCNST